MDYSFVALAPHMEYPVVSCRLESDRLQQLCQRELPYDIRSRLRHFVIFEWPAEFIMQQLLISVQPSIDPVLLLLYLSSSFIPPISCCELHAMVGR